MTIHGLAHTLADRGLDHIGTQVEDRDQLGSLQAVEITQHMVLRPPPGGSADAHSAARAKSGPPQCSTIERNPLWPAVPPPILSRTTPKSRSSSS